MSPDNRESAKAEWRKLKQDILAAQPVVQRANDWLDGKQAELRALCDTNACGNARRVVSEQSGSYYDKGQTVTYLACDVCCRYDEIGREVTGWYE